MVFFRVRRWARHFPHCHYPCRGKPGHVKDTGHTTPSDKLFVLGGVVAEVGVHRCGPTRMPPTLRPLGVVLLGVHCCALRYHPWVAH